MLTLIPPDGGPVYAETHMGRFIVEPWNSISSLAYVITSLYFLYKIRKNLTNYPFIVFSAILLMTGGVGSTLYHAFRSSWLLLWMDVFPIILLTVSLSIYFWLKILKKWWLVMLILFPFILLRFSLFSLRKHFPEFNQLPEHTIIAISYIISGIMIFIPVIIYLFKTQFLNWAYILSAILLFLISLLFREIDLEMKYTFHAGSHFLWHIFSAAGAAFMGKYLINSYSTRYLNHSP